MIKEVLVVEGKMDVVAIDKAVEADCIITGGFSLKKSTMNSIEQAYRKRGIIIMTDPDSAGERIRKFLTKRFPEARHAFVPKEDATANDDIGIEQASPTKLPQDQAAPGAPRQPSLPPAGRHIYDDMRDRAQPSVPLCKSKIVAPKFLEFALDAEVIFGEPLGADRQLTWSRLFVQTLTPGCPNTTTS